MIRKATILALLQFCICKCLVLVHANLESEGTFTYQSILDANGDFRLFWKSDDETITFRYSAATKGWSGLGFSPNGGMKGSDIVLLWVDENGRGQISDRHATHNGFPPEDAKQDYTLLDSAKNDTHLVVTFSRKKNTCDPEDWLLSDDTVRIIYASNDAIPLNKDTFQKHSIRGAKSVHLFDRKMSSADDGDDEKTIDAQAHDFKVTNVHVPENESTTYWCEILKMPKFGKKMHVIKFEPMIEEQNLDVVHHIVMYACSKDMHEQVGKGRSCFQDDGETEEMHVTNCRQQLVTAWAVGGQAIIYPDDIGYPIYNDSSDMYLMMEMHYDNSYFKKGKVDNSGMRLWFTDQLRPIDAGQLFLGTPVSADMAAIPPGHEQFTVYGYCSSNCTQGFPEEGIKVIGGFLHTHLAGRKVRVSHIRDGKQLPPILADEHYDFNFQDTRRLKEPVTILPGDVMVVECVYETLDRVNTTFSGHGTHDEMCVVFLDYYPAIYRGFVCFGSPDTRNLWKTLGIETVPQSESNPFNTSVLTPDGIAKSLSHYLKEDFRFDWTPEKIEAYQKEARDGTHSVMCFHQDIDKPLLNVTDFLDNTTEGFGMYQQHGYPRITEPLVVSDACANIGGSKMPSDTVDGDREANESKNRISQTTTEKAGAQQLIEKDGVGDKNAGQLAKGPVVMIAILALTATYMLVI